MELSQHRRLPPGYVLKEDGFTGVYPMTHRLDGTWHKEHIVRIFTSRSSDTSPLALFVPKGQRRQQVRRNKIPGMDRMLSPNAISLKASARQNAKTKKIGQVARETKEASKVNVSLLSDGERSIRLNDEDRKSQENQHEATKSVEEPQSSKHNNEKKARAIRKKLRQIETLKLRIDGNGDSLNDDQRSKLMSEANLVSELKNIERLLDSISV
mmetsp:Transcript_39713/g.93021  ORF Transcript_39713/g.93021 Transcript_39713/m.93021 type:complete len:212 (-) Transcript_39713:113-748(-)